jgi:carboxypeptidase C (cathepsin A)
MSIPRLLAAVALAATMLPVYATPRADDDDSAKKTGGAEKSPALPSDVTTPGTADVGGQHILYSATVGIIAVGGSDGQDAQLGMDGKPLPGSQLALSAPKEDKDAAPVARMSYVAYIKKDAKAEDRPITFFYNGGPGSSTVWLHMGSLGPKHVVTNGDQHLPAAPYKMVNNADSLLDVSDVVFVDAPGTGFGRLIGKDPEKAFWGVDEDGAAFARFIARFITKYGRWNSPKFLFGESYGTTRSAVLAKMLEDRSIDLNGVILLSQAFNFNIDIDGPNANPGIDLPYVLALPTYAATAWYHKKVSPQPAEIGPFLKEVEEFAVGPYSTALALGTDLPDSQKQSVAEKLHGYTGLPVAYLMKANLRVSGTQFEKSFADDLDLTIGRLDTRFTGPSLNPLSEGAQYDPQSSAISSAYVSLFNDYVRRDLKYGNDQTFLPGINVFEGSNKWNFEHGDNPISLNVSNDLADAMKQNPQLKVMVNGGYFDLATPFYAAEYEDKHLPISRSLAKNIEYAWYESGHMVYVHDESLKQLHDRVAAFEKNALTTK